ncbi:NTF2 and RRM domain [Cordyceps militaris]|uniref:NTF2 and RRM domain n=1 Tax=Cordyceps militaris TaxID=73501 RepID=A0A2H4SMZ5_CORMI|nr:NTF2 and RRM domain [Cordyceps militaris]
MATNGSFAQQDQHKAPADQFSSPSDNSNLAKDEVGWYFVEQYYTTLSKSPEKLHLFYSKRSQLVCGQEAEVSNVSVGRQAIQERLKSLDFQDCKVRVSNVDSQSSDESIVIQVIGETSNKGAEPRKFVQTFVLAQQPSGYFVLNDILRYIEEEEETPAEEAQEEPIAVAAAEAPETAPEPAVEEPPVEKKLISEVAEKAPINGEHVETATEAETEPETKVEAPATPAVEPIVEEVAQEVVKEEEKPKEPAPTPAKVETPAPEPAGPPKPMTWASRAAAAAGPRPVVPLPKTATPPATNQSRAPAPAAAPVPAPAPAPAPVANATAPAVAPPAAAETGPKEVSGWQTAGADSKRQNRPQPVSAAAGTEKEGTMGYVKYVTDKVQDADLRAALAAHGELSYFDINRQKNCAFVEYKTLEGYQTAVSSNPHTVNGENIVVEPRRPKVTGHNGGASFGAGRGNGAPRGRGGFDGRNGGQGNTRGNFGGQNRGRGGAARGRGGAQAAHV